MVTLMSYSCLLAQVWTSAVVGLAGNAECHSELLMRAYARKEAISVASRMGDEDVFIRVNHALLKGVGTSHGGELLREAYAVDRIASGASIEGFVARWLPPDLNELAPDFRNALRVLQVQS